jgi:hypothetical protein
VIEKSSQEKKEVATRTHDAITIAFDHRIVPSARNIFLAPVSQKIKQHVLISIHAYFIYIENYSMQDESSSTPVRSSPQVNTRE